MSPLATRGLTSSYNSCKCTCVFYVFREELTEFVFERVLFLVCLAHHMELCSSWPTKSLKEPTANTRTCPRTQSWWVWAVELSDKQISGQFSCSAHLLSVFVCKQNALEYITMAALSKLFAVATTYPYQVVRVRLQDQHNKYNGVMDVLRRTWRYDVDDCKPSGIKQLQ